jgi:hypothetical protein
MAAMRQHLSSIIQLSNSANLRNSGVLLPENDRYVQYTTRARPGKGKSNETDEAASMLRQQGRFTTDDGAHARIAQAGA